MDVRLRDEIGAPRFRSEEALVSKDKDVGYMLRVRCRWDEAQRSPVKMFVATKMREYGKIQVHWWFGSEEAKILC